MLGGGHDARARVYRRLASLENAGIPLMQGVERVVEGGGPGETILADVSQGLRDGLDPAEAFQAGEHISHIEGRLVGAAAKSGSLPEVFEQLAELFEERGRTLRSTVAALIYPAFLLHAAVIIPAIPALFMDEKSGGGVVGFLSQAGLPLLAIYGLGAGCYAAHRAFRTAAPEQADATLLSVPVLGKAIHKTALATSLQVLRTFYANGVPMLEALDAAAESCPNHVIRKRFEVIRERVGQGDSLAAAFASDPTIPSLVTEMVSTGETTGELDHMLEKAERQLRESASQAKTALLALLSAAAFLAVVVLIAYRVISFYMNLYGQLDAF